MNGGVFLWGWDATNEVWRKVLVDSDGKITISDADPFEITQTTPEDLRHVPHGYDYTNLVYRPIAVNTSGKQLVEHVNTKIIDADGDTKVDTEESTDEDKIRMDVEGTEAFLLSDIGELTLAKQAAARAYLNTADQKIPTGAYTKVALDAESYDVQNEFNTTRKAGTADATEANKLHDADGGFAASDVGATIWNTTDNTYTTVSGFVDSGELDLTDDIMVNGEGYVLFHARYTATEAGYYVITASLYIYGIVDQKAYMVALYQNGLQVAVWPWVSSGTGYQISPILDIKYLAANDYLELKCNHVSGVTEDLKKNAGATFMSVAKIA